MAKAKRARRVGEIEDESNGGAVELVTAVAQQPDGAGAKNAEPELLDVGGAWVVALRIDQRVVPGADVNLVDRLVDGEGRRWTGCG